MLPVRMVVVDSSVLIHFMRIGKLEILKNFFKKIIVPNGIAEEIKKGTLGAAEFQQACKSWICIINPLKKEEVMKLSKSEEVGVADASVIILAREKKKIILANDAALIAIAKSYGIETWWPTSFLIESLKKKKITKEEAKKVLFNLVGSGMHLRNDVYAAILNEIERI